ARRGQRLVPDAGIAHIRGAHESHDERQAEAEGDEPGRRFPRTPFTRGSVLLFDDLHVTHTSWDRDEFPCLRLRAEFDMPSPHDRCRSFRGGTMTQEDQGTDWSAQKEPGSVWPTPLPTSPTPPPQHREAHDTTQRDQEKAPLGEQRARGQG